MFLIIILLTQCIPIASYIRALSVISTLGDTVLSLVLCDDFLFASTVVLWSDNVGDIQWREGSISWYQSLHPHAELGTGLPVASAI